MLCRSPGILFIQFAIGFQCSPIRGLVIISLMTGPSSDKPVDYDEQADDGEIIPDELVEQKVYESFFVKHPDWKYENEWRIVKESECPTFQFGGDELVAVIFGHNMSKGNQRIIKRMLNPAIKLYFTHIGGQSGSIRLIPDEYVFPGNGTKPDFISTVDELYEAIMQTD